MDGIYPHPDDAFEAEDPAAFEEVERMAAPPLDQTLRHGLIEAAIILVACLLFFALPPSLGAVSLPFWGSVSAILLMMVVLLLFKTAELLLGSLSVDESCLPRRRSALA